MCFCAHLIKESQAEPDIRFLVRGSLLYGAAIFLYVTVVQGRY